ncbi:MAG: hypothetical protein ACP5D7_12635 [Limnospira sp.]
MKLSYSMSGISDRVLYNPFVSEVELLPPVGKGSMAEEDDLGRIVFEEGESLLILEENHTNSRSSVLFGFFSALIVLGVLGGLVASQASQVSRGIVRSVPTEYQKVARDFPLGGW